MSIDGSFYKNVSVLMQVVPASYECTKHFKKGMFDKPNTSGFIHITHYLLSVHNKKRFQKMVTWPIMNKVDERKYRTEIKDYIGILANEHQDINFPSILMSHLLQAGGMKFLIIMWKISQISLRTYIKRNCRMELLHAPILTDNNGLTQTYFTNINKSRVSETFTFYEKTKSMKNAFKDHMQMRSNDLKKIQIAIFKIKKDIERSIGMVPVNPLVATRLTDTEDVEIIELWKESIHQSIQILLDENSYFNKLKILSQKLHSIISDLCTSSKVFDANKLPKIDINIISMCFNNNIQDIDNGLYKNGCLVFHIFLLTFDQIMKQVECYLKLSNLPDLSDCPSKINEYSKILQSMNETLQSLMEQVSTMLYNTQCSLQDKSMNCTLETDFLHPMAEQALSRSPKLNFSTNKCITDDNLLNRLSFSPTQGTHKHLFQRYKRNFHDSSIQSTSKNRFNNSIKSISINWKTPQRESFTCKKYSPNRMKTSGRYTKLFSTSNSKRNHFRDAASTPHLSRPSTTPKKSKSLSSSSSSMNIESAVKDLFDLSCKITDVLASLSEP